MFETVFKTELAFITSDTTLIDALWAEIRKEYEQPGRHYHTLHHLDHMAAELLPVKSDVEDWPILVFAVAYHDIVYDAPGMDNEARSAAFAHKRLTRLGLPDMQILKCMGQIIATKDHEPNRNNDTNFLIDADLSILGAEKEVYWQYAQSIRKEFRTFPDFMFLPGRRKALQYFLDMDFIYKTLHFQTLYEQQARANIAFELKAIS